MNMLVTIITASFNSEATLKDTIKSVLGQSYDRLEYIIIDGNSSDKSLEIIRSFEKDFIKRGVIYKWQSEPDKGIYHAMNKGLSMAAGDLIGILNSDDWYFPEAVSEMVNLTQDDQFSISSGNLVKVGRDKKPLKTLFPKRPIGKYIFKTMPVNHPATFVHKNVYKKIGPFDLSYTLSADYDLIIRAYLAGATFLYSKKTIVNMRKTGASHDLKNIFITAREDYLIRKKNNIKLAYFYYLKRLVLNYLIIVRDKLRAVLTMGR